MTKYNQRKVTPSNEVTNLNGGQAVKFVPELELISLLSSGLDGQFHEKESEREKRLFDVIKNVGKKNPELVAKALIYARTVMGQRSVTHVGAIAALQVISGTPIAAKFFSKRDRKENKGGIVYRLDDMLEIIAYYFLRNPNKPLPNSIRRGFKRALETADAYELAKYQGKKNVIKLVDVVNLVRPKPSEKMVQTFKKLMSGELKQFNTAEDKNTKAGQVVAAKVKSGEISKNEGEAILNEAKADNWKTLISDGSIGYLALLRNLRNLVNVADDATYAQALNMLTDEKRVRKSLVFPHQIDIAFEVILNEGVLNSQRKVSLLTAINKAYELSIPNLTELFSHGRTAVVVDTSSSMRSGVCYLNSNKINSRAVDKASLIGATLVKGIGADLYSFDSNCRAMHYNPLDSINTIKNVVVNNTNGGDTRFETIFNNLNGKYDRVFVISDMQGSDSLIRSSSYQTYVKTHGQPFIYAINLCGYSSTMFKQSEKLINLFGYSSDIYEMIRNAEINVKAILKEIEKIVI